MCSPACRSWWIDVVFALLMVGSLFMMFRAKRRSEEKA